MNKKELCNALAEKTGLTKTEAQKAFNAVIEIVANEMKKRMAESPLSVSVRSLSNRKLRGKDESDFFRPD